MARKHPEKPAWEKHQIKAFVDRAKYKWGDGWRLLSEEQKTGALAIEALSVLRTQHRVDISVSDIDQLWLDMLVRAGLLSEKPAPGLEEE